MPGAVRVFKMWVQAVLNLGSLFLSIFFVMLCLAALAVIGIRELCPHRTCFPGTLRYMAARLQVQIDIHPSSYRLRVKKTPDS